MNSRQYYTLIGFRTSDHRAEIMFGSYIRSDVAAEQDEYRYNNQMEDKKDRYYEKFQIIVSDDTNEAIFAEMADAELIHRQKVDPTGLVS